VVQLFPGFTASSGSVFTALIDECQTSDYNPDDLRVSEIDEQENLFSDFESALKIYPNPADDVATIEFTSLTDLPITVSVSDVTGKEIRQSFSEAVLAGEKFKTQIRTKDLIDGFYMCIIKSGDKMFTQKFLVQH